MSGEGIQKEVIFFYNIFLLKERQRSKELHLKRYNKTI